MEINILHKFSSSFFSSSLSLKGWLMLGQLICTFGDSWQIIPSPGHLSGSRRVLAPIHGLTTLQGSYKRLLFSVLQSPVKRWLNNPVWVKIQLRMEDLRRSWLCRAVSWRALSIWHLQCHPHLQANQRAQSITACAHQPHTRVLSDAGTTGVLAWLEIASPSARNSLNWLLKNDSKLMFHI